MGELPFELSRQRVVVGVCALVAVLALAGRLLLRSADSAPPPVSAPPPAAAAATTTASRVVVDVVGAVRRPGLYRFEQGARIADAVARAGGASRKADLAQVNLAAPLADGEQVVVPRRGAVAATPGPAATAGTPSAAPAGPVHLNTATLDQLDSLPGVGPVTAQKILDYRAKHGAFGSVDELDAVPGIGPARLDQLRDLVAP
jgi:competence protein ComEA